MVWVEFLTTSIIFGTTSKKLGCSREGMAWGGHNAERTPSCTGNKHWHNNVIYYGSVHKINIEFKLKLSPRSPKYRNMYFIDKEKFIFLNV